MCSDQDAKSGQPSEGCLQFGGTVLDLIRSWQNKLRIEVGRYGNRRAAQEQQWTFSGLSEVLHLSFLYVCEEFPSGVSYYICQVSYAWCLFKYCLYNLHCLSKLCKVPRPVDQFLGFFFCVFFYTRGKKKRLQCCTPGFC